MLFHPSPASAHQRSVSLRTLVETGWLSSLKKVSLLFQWFLRVLIDQEFFSLLAIEIPLTCTFFLFPVIEEKENGKSLSFTNGPFLLIFSNFFCAFVLFYLDESPLFFEDGRFWQESKKKSSPLNLSLSESLMRATRPCSSITFTVMVSQRTSKEEAVRSNVIALLHVVR